MLFYFYFYNSVLLELNEVVLLYFVEAQHLQWGEWVSLSFQASALIARLSSTTHSD